MSQLVLPPDHSKKLLRISFLSLGSCIFALLNSVYDGAYVAGSVFLFSINYWRNPVYGTRRNIDITNNLLCLAYQTWRCFSVATPFTLGFLLFTYAGLGCFFVSRHLDDRLGTVAHMFTHILANIGNLILYTGLALS